MLIELRARFDEQNNIDWSERLETAGCRVIYGFEGFKVHSKVCLITRLEHGNPRYITQIATGNYNEKTAAQYTDLSLITADQNIGRDAAEFFRNMAIGNLEGEYKCLMVAPNSMKSRIMGLIDEEIQKGKDGQIIFKVNSVTDLEVINKLSEASCAGVRIVMLVRGICCLLPGVPGYTENIRVFSIVGRYLEHSRIYSFGAGAGQKLYISSADLMTRNMQRRVEVAVPIYASHIRERVNHILDVYFRDTAKARELKSDGNYERFPEYKTGLSAQEQFMAEALENAETEKPHGEGKMHRFVRERVTHWYRSPDQRPGLRACAKARRFASARGAVGTPRLRPAPRWTKASRPCPWDGRPLPFKAAYWTLAAKVFDVAFVGPSQSLQRLPCGQIRR